MKINSKEFKAMTEETYAPGYEMVKAMNLMYDLVAENGLQNDPRYTEAVETLYKSMTVYQNISYERGLELCKKHSILNALKKKTFGKYLLDKVMKELED